MAGTGAPLLTPLVSVSPFACWIAPFLSVWVLLSAGGPIEGAWDGVVSIGSRGGEGLGTVVELELLEAEGRMGMDLCSAWW
jgi:hypothetical protein